MPLDVLGDHHQPVRLLQVEVDLAEKHIRRDADRAGEAFADLLAQGPLHLLSVSLPQCSLKIVRSYVGLSTAISHSVDRLVRWRYLGRRLYPRMVLMVFRSSGAQAFGCGTSGFAA
jgi:hypothetical protein